MRTRTLLLPALFLTAVLATARGQTPPATPSADTTPTAPAVVEKTPPAATPPAPVAEPTPAPAPAAGDAIKETEPTHPVVTTTPATTKPKEAGKDTLSVDFPDTDIREILRNVADLFELNLVMPDTLQGKASIKLRDVTWRQIFDVVLKQVGYTYVEKDNIVKVVSLADLQNEPFTTRTFSFENVSSARILPLVAPMLTPKRDATASTLAQPGGTIVNAELSNELIVTDQSTVLARIGDMIKRLDAEPKQVVIETKFVEISLDNTKNREVALGFHNNAGTIQGGTGLSSSNPSITTGLTAINPFVLGSGTLLGGSPSVVLNRGEFSAMLNILNASNNVRLVTNPTIVAINGSKSEIKIGRELQLVTITTTTSGSSPVSTATAGDIKFVGISLEVTPQITGNKLIALKVKPVKSSVFKVTPVLGNNFYDIDKREGDLNIILRDGQTAAIGGLVDTSVTKSKTKVPLLGDIPLLGALFRNTSDVVNSTNLIIFITASVLEPSRMKYENVISQDQLEGLELTPRDVLGRNYTKSDEEVALQEQVGIVRQKKQEAEAMARMHQEISDDTPSSIIPEKK